MINLVPQTLPLLAMLTPPQAAEYTALLPGGILCLAALLIILLDVFHTYETSREYLGYVTAVAFGLTLAVTIGLWNHPLDTPALHGMLYLDRYSLFFAGVISFSGLLAALFAPAYLHLIKMDRSEFYTLTLFSASGAVLMVASADLLSIFIALEVMSIPLYCIAAFVREDRRSAEAGLKYFILGAFSTALTLYGIALIYGMTGTTNLESIAVVIQQLLGDGNAASFEASSSILVIGVFLVLAGFIFKAAIAPFHVWTPDVYTGTPTPATGFMATAVKAAAFGVLLRLLLIAFHSPEIEGGGAGGIGWIDALFAFAAISVVLGNFAAIVQDNVKRMLAYSSIAHAGYILVAVVAANIAPEFYLFNDSVLFYLFAYTFTTAGAFGLLSVLAKKSGRPVETYDDLKGVGLAHPVIGAAMAIFMFSSAGIPPTAGFLAKFYVFRAAVDVGAATGEYAFIGLAILAVLSSICGVYYYLRVLVSMFMKAESDDVEVVGKSGAKFALVVCAVVVLAAGIFPQMLINWSQAAVIDMVGPTQVAKEMREGADALRSRELAAQQHDNRVLEASIPVGGNAPGAKPAASAGSRQAFERYLNSDEGREAILRALRGMAEQQR